MFTFAAVINGEKYQVVIGLEVHAQLLTKSKLFCADSTAFGAAPNTQVSPISLAHPGTLPKLNKKAIEHAVKLGLALHCNIQPHNYFARKNYFYPDLPKGYQVSQHTAPVCNGGYVSIQINNTQKNVKLNRIHMEEDAGKSIHDADDQYTCIDLNRAGVPLLEIVSEPDMHSAEEAYAFLTELRKIVRWLAVCDGNMEEGSMRCDANISVRLKNETKLGTRVEVKNLNSIRNVKKSIEIETERLITIVENNGTIIQETRSFDADNNSTFSLRSKEEADDYRYFPEPDLPPFFISENYIKEVLQSMPVLPETLKQQYISNFSLSEYDAAAICSDKEDAEYFDALIQVTKNYKAAANWFIGPIRQYCNEHVIPVTSFPLHFNSIAALIELVESGKISFNTASSKLLNALITTPETTAYDMAVSLNLLQESDTAVIEDWINKILLSMPDKVKEYKAGKKGLIGLFSGEIKKISKGKADMQLVNKLLSEKLGQ